MNIYAKKLAVSLALPLAVGLLAAVLIRGGVASYGDMPQPPLAPSAVLFPIVWTILYLLMGVASYLVWTQPKPSPAAVTVYPVQLAVNFIWPLLFFNAGTYGAALVCIAVLWLLVLATLLLFFNTQRAAGLLMLPYLAWVTFAAVLNYGAWMLNG